MRPSVPYLAAGVALLASLPLAGLVLAGLALAGDEPLSWRLDLQAFERTRVAAVLAEPRDFSRAEEFEALPGGAATTLANPDRNAFSRASANLAADDQLRFRMGQALFGKLWVAAPSSTQASDGLGPLYNARACESCHQRSGRGHPPANEADSTSFVLRLARPPRTEAEQRRYARHETSGFPDPVYGQQLQDKAIPGLAGEGRPLVRYREEPVVLAGGETASLRVPAYSISGLAYGPLDPATTLSPRLTPQLIGLGLIEAIHADDIAQREDPDDRDHDGISGRAAHVRDPDTGLLALGRFGWKAQSATVKQQSASALALDIGISSALVDRPYGDCEPAQAACLSRPTGVQPRLGATEASAMVLDLLSVYVENLAVPARRQASDTRVLAGKQVFHGLGCAACHVPNYVTRRDAAISTLGYQLIWPYSDFLLHDMGEGLADGQPVGDASGREWRTPPLWGIGLTPTVNGHGFYLHDGRARSLTEAILWHDGEGKTAGSAFGAASPGDRQALLTFLESL